MHKSFIRVKKSLFSVYERMHMLTYNVKLILEESDKKRLLAVLEAERWAFNYCSTKHFRKDKPRKNSVIELHAACYHAIRTERPDIPSQIVIRAEQSCLAAYRTVKSNRHRLEEPVNKKALSIRLDKRIYRFTGKTSLAITAIEGKRIPMRFEPYPKMAELMAQHEMCDPLIFERDGQFWLSLSFDNPEPAHKEGLALGVDLGVNRAIVTSEGVIFKDKRYNAQKRRLRYLKRQLKSAVDVKKSKSAKRHLKKLARKEMRKSRNQTHLIVNQLLANPATTYVLEDLTGLKQKTSKKRGPRINNKVSQAPFYLIKQTLTYKARALGKRVTTVSPFETSQRDNRTGKKDGERRGSRYYARDGVVFDADCNAAINIAKRSKLPFSRGNVLDGQVVVTRPIV